MASRLKLSRSLDKRRSRLQDGQLPDCRRYGSYPETVLDEVIEANRRPTWTINAYRTNGFPSFCNRPKLGADNILHRPPVTAGAKGAAESDSDRFFPKQIR